MTITYPDRAKLQRSTASVYKKFEETIGKDIIQKIINYHAVYNTGSERIRLLVVGGIMLVPLWPKWPTETPYEIDAADTKS